MEEELRWPPAGMSLNNLCYHDDPIETPRQGTVEVWEIVNTSSTTTRSTSTW